MRHARGGTRWVGRLSDEPMGARAAYLAPVSARPDETQQLLSQLEAELATEQAKLDERLAREQARLDELTRAAEQYDARREQASAELEELLPRRDAMMKRRDVLRTLGAKADPIRAVLWGGLAVALTLGAVMPLAATPPDLFLVTLGGAAVTTAIGWFGVDLWKRSRR